MLRYFLSSSSYIIEKFRFFLACFLLPAAGGCAIATPKIQEIWDVDIPAYTAGPEQKYPYSASSRIEYEVLRRVYCDLREGIRRAQSINPTQGKTLSSMKVVHEGLIPENWGAQVSLSMQVEETSSIAPGFSLISPLANVATNPGSNFPVVNSQSSSVGFGATLSSTATRIDKIDPYWSVSLLLEPLDPKQSKCYIDPETGGFKHGPFDKYAPKSISSPFILDSDLGIQDWVTGSMLNNSLMPSQGKRPKYAENSPGPDTITLQLKFVIVSSASVTPTWRLARISANTGDQFFGTGRTRTHDLIITLGPQDDRTRNTFFASQISQALDARR